MTEKELHKFIVRLFYKWRYSIYHVKPLDAKVKILEDTKKEYEELVND